MKAALLLWVYLCALPRQCFMSAAVVTISYNASNMIQLEAAVKQVALNAAYRHLHSQLAAINVQASISMTASLHITEPVTIRGVLQLDGTWPTLDCGAAAIQALTITADGVTVANLGFRRCHNSAVVVQPTAPDHTYRFSNLWFQENSVLRDTIGAGGIAFVENNQPVIATLINCTFVNNTVSSDTDVVFGESASAFLAFFGHFTLTNCTFIGNGDLSTAQPVVAFHAVKPTSDSADYADYFGGTRGGAPSGDYSGYNSTYPGDYSANPSGPPGRRASLLATPPAATSLALSLVVDGLALVNNSGLLISSGVSTPGAIFLVVQAKLASLDVCNINISNGRFVNNSGNIVFMVDNPQGNRKQTGALGCASFFTDTLLKDNTIGSGDESAGFPTVWMFKGQSSLNLTRVVVSDNANVESFLSLSHVDSTVLSNCTFSDNAVSACGLRLHLHSSSTVAMDGCTFAGNYVSPPSAATGGAAIYAASVIGTLLLSSCNFTSNGGSAFGGAVNVAAGISTFALTACAFVNNTALLGGGAFFYQAAAQNIQSTVTSCVFTGNSAAYGGAMLLSTANTITFEYCAFMYNTAASGGAVVISDNAQTQQFYKCNFTMNRADMLLGSTDDELLYLNACGPGGGGALCVVGSGMESLSAVTLRTCVLSNNSAVFGGAIYVGQGTACAVVQHVPRGNAACYQFNVFNCQVDGNTARAGAGGAVYLHDLGIINIWCTVEQGGWAEELAPPGLVLNNTRPSETLEGDYSIFVVQDGRGVLVPFQPSMQQLPCRSWLGNSAIGGGYGPVVATPPLKATPVAPTTPSSIISPDLVPVYMNVTDWYQQLVTTPLTSVVAVASLTTKGPFSQLSDALVVQAEVGLVNMSSLTLQATPGTHVLTVTVSQSAPSIRLLATFAFDIEVKPCPPDFYANPAHNQCTPYSRCRSGSYRSNITSQECALCPANALCSDSNIGYGAIVPNAGFWHSHPLSAEIHPCDNVVACAARGRSTRLAAAQEELINATLFGENVTDLLTSYLEELCADEYRGGGVLCGECSNGFGHVAVVTCKKCLPRRSVIAVHIVLTLVTLAFVTLTVRSSLATALWLHPESTPSPFTATASLDSRPSDGRAPALQGVHRHRISHGTRRRGGALSAVEDWTPPLDMPPPDSPRLFDEKLIHSRGGELAQDAAGGVTSRAGALPRTALDAHSKAASAKAQDSDVTPQSTFAHAASPLSLKTSMRRSATGEDGLYAPAAHSHHRTADNSHNSSEEGAGQHEPQHMTIILILVSYLQVLAMPRRIPLLWPDVLLQLLNVVSMATSAAGSLAAFECFVAQNQRVTQIIQISMIQILEPVAMMAVIAAFWAARVAWKQRQGDLKVPAAWYMKRRLILSACVIVFYVYPSITDVVIGSFACQAVDTAAGVRAIEAQGYEVLPGSVGTFWREELNQLCYSGQHWIQFWVIGIPGLIFFAAGVPTACLYLLWHHRHDLQQHSFKAMWGFLYEEFQPHCFYWEVLGESRKLLIITIISVVSNTRPGVQLLASLGVLLAACMAQVLMTPYRSPAMNHLETVALLALLSTFWLLTFFVVNPGSSHATSTALAALVTVINGGTVLYLLGCLLVEVWKAVQSQAPLQRTVSASFMRLLSRSATSLRAATQGVPCCTSQASCLYGQTTHVQTSGGSTLGTSARTASTQNRGRRSGKAETAGLGLHTGKGPVATGCAAAPVTAEVMLEIQGALELVPLPQELVL